MRRGPPAVERRSAAAEPRKVGVIRRPRAAAEIDSAAHSGERDCSHSPTVLRANIPRVPWFERLRLSWPALVVVIVFAGTLSAAIGAISWSVFAALGLQRAALYAAGFGSGCGFWAVITQHWIRGTCADDDSTGSIRSKTLRLMPHQGYGDRVR
jgi:hypothetical protein